MPTATGSIRLDGVEIAGWAKEELGPQLGYLPQGVGLFQGTTKENISRFKPADPRALEQAISEWQLGGLASPIGEDGRSLSGGERQRLGLARAYYGSPALLVLDEPDAALDDQGLSMLSMALETAKSRGATQIIISHRGRWVEQANKVLVLQQGTQVAFGPPQDVLQRVGTSP
jgi:ABC-type protease/lipase transport system fused ATPase/permease subunit